MALYDSPRALRRPQTRCLFRHEVNTASMTANITSIPWLTASRHAAIARPCVWRRLRLHTCATSLGAVVLCLDRYAARVNKGVLRSPVNRAWLRQGLLGSRRLQSGPGDTAVARGPRRLGPGPCLAPPLVGVLVTGALATVWSAPAIVVIAALVILVVL